MEQNTNDTCLTQASPSWFFFSNLFPASQDLKAFLRHTWKHAATYVHSYACKYNPTKVLHGQMSNQHQDKRQDLLSVFQDSDSLCLPNTHLLARQGVLTLSESIQPKQAWLFSWLTSQMFTPWRQGNLWHIPWRCSWAEMICSHARPGMYFFCTKARIQTTPQTHLASLNILTSTSKLSYQEKPQCPQDWSCHINYVWSLCPKYPAWTGLQAEGAGSLLHRILKQRPADNQQGNHSASQLVKGCSSCLPATSHGLQGKAFLQRLLFQMETGQMSGCFGSAGGKLFAANHCEEAAQVIKSVSLVPQSFHFYKNIFQVTPDETWGSLHTPPCALHLLL